MNTAAYSLLEAGGRKYLTAPERARFVAAVEAGVPLPTIAAILGHADLTTTAIYTTAIGAEARELVARMW